MNEPNDDQDIYYDESITSSAGVSCSPMSGITKYDNETIEYLKTIISDDTYTYMIEYLETAKISKRTQRNLIALIVNTYSIEYVLNHYPGYSWYHRHSIYFRGMRTRMIWSRMESKMGDIHYILDLIEKHHRNKIMRSVGGFEREIQHTTISHGSHENRTKPTITAKPKKGILNFVKGDDN